MSCIKTISHLYQQTSRQWHVKRSDRWFVRSFMKIRCHKSQNGSKPLRVGFVPLWDCAPLVMAQELGLFEKHGLRVRLSREVGWATVRDKVLYRELDAAHALAPIVFATSFGLGSVPTACVTGLVLSSNGNAITLGQSLWDATVSNSGSLSSLSRNRRQALVFGIPFLYSSHHFLLRSWLRSHGLTPGRDVQLVVVPPPQMPSNLKAGHLDGYCVGEPWNSVATIARFGWRVATSMDIAPHHPEKVLMVQREFSESRPEEHEGLIAALLEACRFCADAKNCEQIIETVGEPQYLDLPVRALRVSFASSVPHSGATDMFALEAAHEPTADQAAWVLDQMRESGLLPDPVTLELASEIFRTDIFQKATRQNQPYETTQATRQCTS